MKGDVHAHIDAPRPKPSHGYCRIVKEDREYVDGDVKLCIHGKVLLWSYSSDGYSHWNDLDPFGGIAEFKQWRAARRATADEVGKITAPLPPPRTGGYPATRPVPSGLSGAIQDAMGDGQRVEKSRSTGVPPAEPNESVLTVELRDRNRLGFERKRTFTVSLDRMPGESSRRFNMRIFGLAMEKLAESDAR